MAADEGGDGIRRGDVSGWGVENKLLTPNRHGTVMVLLFYIVAGSSNLILE